VSRQLQAWLIFNVRQKKSRRSFHRFSPKLSSTRAFLRAGFQLNFPPVFGCYRRYFGFRRFKKIRYFFRLSFRSLQEVSSVYFRSVSSQSSSLKQIAFFDATGGTSFKMKTTEPNQALEPTTTAVTDRAGARSAPAAVVAHL
jgi:hypothetical protein